MIYSQKSDADRAFFRDVLGLNWVDAGGGWLIFALPPAELAIHPAEEKPGPEGNVLKGHHQLYLMCDDAEATMQELQGKGVKFTQPINDAGWGRVTALKLPGGSELWLYQPRHASPIRQSSAESDSGRA